MFFVKFATAEWAIVNGIITFVHVMTNLKYCITAITFVVESAAHFCPLLQQLLLVVSGPCRANHLGGSAGQTDVLNIVLAGIKQLQIRQVLIMLL